jgi:hypothetical protein
MNTDNSLGTLDDVVADYSAEMRPIVLRLRALILDIDPETTEQPRPGDRALSYGVGPRKMLDGYATIMAQSTYVNLGFYQGTALPDPAGLLEGTGKKLRHVKVRTAAETDAPALRDLVAAAVAERRTARET